MKIKRVMVEMDLYRIHPFQRHDQKKSLVPIVIDLVEGKKSRGKQKAELATKRQELISLLAKKSQDPSLGQGELLVGKSFINLGPL